MGWIPLYNTYRYFRRLGCRILKEDKLVICPCGINGRALHGHVQRLRGMGYDFAEDMFPAERENVLLSSGGSNQIYRRTESRSGGRVDILPGADMRSCRPGHHIQNKGRRI